MSFKIGFAAKTEDQIIDKKNQNVNNCEELIQAKKSVVDVFFPDRHLTCTYYNDMFDLKRGDIVFVDGKLEGLRGRVVKVSYTFKIKLSDYKRVIGVADTNVSGEFHMAGSHFIALERTSLPFEQIITWFKAPEAEEEEFVSSADDETFNLSDLSGMKIDKAAADRGHDYYIENRVAYIEIKDNKARAIVNGTKPYEVEFNYHNGDISGLICNCYCTGACKHEFATMLQLKETLEAIGEKYGNDFNPNYLAIISKFVFFEYLIDNKTKGCFTLN